MTRANKLFLLLISFWIFIATSRTFFNVSKLFTEERNWYKLSVEQKKEKFFGDTHFFLRFLDSHTANNSLILLFSNDLKVRYLGGYYLYPQKKIVITTDPYFKNSKKSYDYIVIYPANKQTLSDAKNNTDISKFKEVATYKGKENQIGIIYKK